MGVTKRKLKNKCDVDHTQKDLFGQLNGWKGVVGLNSVKLPKGNQNFISF